MGDDESRWKRLGELLTARRIELGGSNRTRFLEQNGVAKQARIISDIELGKRTNYERGTLSLVEHLYQWGPGSIGRVLNGEEPVILAVPHHGGGPRQGDVYEGLDMSHLRPVGAGKQDEDPVLFLLSAEEHQRLDRLPAQERQRVLDAARAAARATADALLGTGDEE